MAANIGHDKKPSAQKKKGEKLQPGIITFTSEEIQVSTVGWQST